MPWISSPLTAYPVALGVIACALFLQWPVVAGDTDVWYHLNGGRYLVEHGRLPTDSFFSFLAPARPWLDYYWLFQAIVYALYVIGGYPGLIVLRTVMGAVMLAAVFLLLRCGEGRGRSVGWSALVFATFLLVFMPRLLLVRPHLFTYALTAAFLWILEARPKLRWALPLLGLLWCNVHGVAYPVMLLVLGAYVLEHFWISRFAMASSRPPRAGAAWPLVVAMLSIYCTPHGVRLLELPFRSLDYARHFIGEFKPVVQSMDLGWLLSVHVNGLAPSYDTVLNVWIWIALGSLVTGLMNRSIRVSHLVLWAGGAMLLTRGMRFANEFALLSLPLMAHHPLVRPAAFRAIPRPITLFSIALLMAAPIQLLRKQLQPTPAYPVSRQSVPAGVAAFLRHVDVGGTIFNPPSTGGYWQWKVYPRYKIFMDLEIPFLFTSEDLYLATYAYLDAYTLGRIIKHYHPTFFSVPTSMAHFPEFIREFPEYRLVFFDDAEVLYANQAAQPQLVQEHELSQLDPFTLFGRPLEEALKDKQIEEMARELRRMTAIDPAAGLTNQLLSLLYQRQNEYVKMIPHARSIISNYPNSPTGYVLFGNALEGLGQFHGALAKYQQALARTQRGAKPQVFRDLGRTYGFLGQHARAYRLLKRSIDVFNPSTSIEDLELLGRAAQLADRSREAEVILRYAREFRGGQVENPKP